MMSLVLWACNSGGNGLPADVRARLDSAAARSRGRAVFLKHCALCHGVHADGRGVRRLGLSGRPTSFRSASWRAHARPERVFDVLENGRPGTSMPAWPALSPTQKWNVIAYVLSLGSQVQR